MALEHGSQFGSGHVALVWVGVHRGLWPKGYQRGQAMSLPYFFSPGSGGHECLKM